MNIRFLFSFVSVVFCAPCFAEEMPTVPELIKKMYDYRMAIENMRCEVTVTFPVDTLQPIKKTVKQCFYFAYDKGRVRCDMTHNANNPQSHFNQYLSTSDFCFTRNPSSPAASHVNEGNSLFIYPPLKQPVETYDPRRIGTAPNNFSRLFTTLFNYDTLMQDFYSPHGENFSISIDNVDGEKLYKISSRQIISDGVVGTNLFWINPQKGYNLVQCEFGVEKYDLHISYAVTLGKFAASKGEIWFPKEIFYRYQMKGTVMEEKIVVDSVTFDVQDETPFTLAGMGIPIGYTVDYLGKATRTWDGKELVEEIPYIYELEPIDWWNARWKRLLIVNAVFLALFALYFLYKFLQRRSN